MSVLGRATKSEGPEEVWTKEGWKVITVSSAFMRNGDSISRSLARAEEDIISERNLRRSLDDVIKFL
jgi:hypothetical protein